MIDKPQQTSMTLPLAALVALMLLVGGVLLARLCGGEDQAGRLALWSVTLVGAAMELGVAAILFIAAAGWAYPVIRRIAPADAPLGLKVISACGLGAWALGTAVLVCGTFIKGSLSPGVWWPVLVAGVALAYLQARRHVAGWALPRRLDGRSLVWIVLAAVVALWLAGAMRPPGFIGMISGDAYDVLEYHLQVPREFFNNGAIGELPHNCYSYYPLGGEMLYLLGMCLRGGAYDGMYLAAILHGCFGVLAVAAIFVTLRGRQDVRARFSVMLLATTPALVCLAWLAMVELAEVFYLTLAVLWLRHWLNQPGGRAAWCIGLAIGGACAVKYLSLGLVALPVLAVMAVGSLRSGTRFKHIAAAALAMTILLSPYLIRNYAYVRNPVFPLATGLLGRGHWSPQEQARWQAGTGPTKQPPVPKPRGWQMPPTRDRVELFFNNFLTSQLLGQLTLLAAGAALVVLAAWKGPKDPWDVALAAMLAIQLAVWTAMAHEMPSRFLVPAAVPLCLLAAGVLERLSRYDRARKQPADGPTLPWGVAPAVATAIAAAAINLMVGIGIFDQDTGRLAVAPLPGEMLAKEYVPYYADAYALGPSAKILLVGDARAFYFPPGTKYATVFDPQPLEGILCESCKAYLPGQLLQYRVLLLRSLRDQGVTHLLVTWPEIWRLAGTYGFPASLSAELYDRWQRGLPPSLDVLRELETQGMTVVAHVGKSALASSQPATGPAGAAAEPALRAYPTTWPATAPAGSARWDPMRPPPSWPVYTIYALPKE